MTQEELVKGLAYLGTAYNKEYTKAECEQHYDFLKEFQYGVFVQAIKNIIRKSKFLPKITELIDECEACKTQVHFEILDYMQSMGYFKDASEYQKATSYLETGIIPDWFKQDLSKYYKLKNQERLTAQKMIGG